jgi:hypothetical protein
MAQVPAYLFALIKDTSFNINTVKYLSSDFRIYDARHVTLFERVYIKFCITTFTHKHEIRKKEYPPGFYPEIYDNSCRYHNYS